MIDLDSLTIGEARRIAAMFPAQAATQPEIPDHPYPVGEAVFVRTVTMHYMGRLVRVTAGELVLTDAAWIADSGRYSVALATGALNEVEPYPDGPVIVSRGALVDVALWAHPLPRSAR